MWKFLLSALTQNLGSKIISVLLGLAVWLHVSTQLHPLEKETVTVEVKVTSVAENLVPRVVPRELEVTVSGEKEEVRRFRPYLRELEAVVTATGRQAGQYETTPELMGLPSGISPARVKVSPTRVVVSLERLASKSLDVSWDFSARPPEEIETDEPVIKPRSVLVAGVEEALQRVAAARVEIDLTKAVSGTVSWLPVRLYDAQGNHLSKTGVRVEPPLVSVTVPIKSISTRVVPVVPQVEKKGEGFQIEEVQVSPATVTLSGAPSALESIANVPTETMVVSGKEERESRSLSLELPAGVRVVGRGEVRVTVAVRRLPAPATKAQPTVEEGAPKPAPPVEESGAKASGDAKGASG